MEKRVDELLLSSSNYLGNIKCDVIPGTPPFKCAIPTCKNKFTYFEEHQLSTFKFHNFPRSQKFEDTWKILCQLSPATFTGNLKICSDHFTLDDYDRNLKDELLNPSRKRSLKETAVPSINVSPSGNGTTSKYYERTQTEVGTTKQLLLKVYSLNKNILSLEKKLISYRKNCIVKKKLELAEIKASRERFENQIAKQTEKTLQSLFSEAQLSLLRGSKKVYWSDDDLAQAFTLRHMGGKEFYLYMKNTLNYPIPSLSCVQAWEPPVCSIVGCSNSVQGLVESTVFYFVPKDLSRASQWANVLKNRIGDTPLWKALICARHFESDSFEPKSNSLKVTAVPLIFPGSIKSVPAEPPQKKLKISNVTTAIKVADGFTKEDLENGLIFVIDEIKDPELNSGNDDIDENDDEADGAGLQEEIARLKAVKQNLLKQEAALVKEANDLADACILADRELKSRKREISSCPEMELQVLTKCFSQAQIRHIVGKSKTRWSVDDLAMAYTISSLASHDFYAYLRNELKFPLPSVSNVNRCYRNMDRKLGNNSNDKDVDEVNSENDE